jgi:hypothetical protein
VEHVDGNETRRSLFNFASPSSIWNLIRTEFVIYICLFYFVGVVERMCPGDVSPFFEIRIYTNAHMTRIPLAFVLSFYMGHIFTRWWAQFCALPSSTKLAHMVAQLDSSSADGHKLLRWLHASAAITFQSISPHFRENYPELGDLETDGLLTPKEADFLQGQPEGARSDICLGWFLSSVAEHSKKPGSTVNINTAYGKVMDFGGSLSTLRSYHNQSVPLGYTQIVQACVYSYFLVSRFPLSVLFWDAFMRSVLDPSLFDLIWAHCRHLGAIYQLTLIDRQQQQEGRDIGLHWACEQLPFCTLLEFLVYIGWLKVATEMEDPFGDDESNFDCLQSLRSNQDNSMAIIDAAGTTHPDE